MKKGAVELMGVIFLAGMILCGCGGKAKTTKVHESRTEATETMESSEAIEIMVSEEYGDREACTTENDDVNTSADITDLITDEEICKAIELATYNQEYSENGKISKIRIDIDKVNNFEELSRLTDLDEVIANAEVTFDIDWLQYCTQITNLELEYNGLSDLSPLMQLDNLKHLKIACSGMENINDLSNIRTLTDIYIESNTINDISAIESMNQLEYFVLKAPKVQLFAGTDWSNLENIRVMAIDCECFTDYNFVSTIQVNPVYTASMEEQALRKDLSTKYQDYRANNYRRNYDFDKVSDETCLAHYILEEESFDNNNTSSLTPADYSDYYVSICNAAYNSIKSDYSPMFMESTVAAVKNYEALGKLGFHIERLETKWDSENYHFIMPGNSAVEVIVSNYLFEISNPIPEIVTSMDNAEVIDTHVPNEWKEGKLWCDGIIYDLNGRIEDMINDSYEYQIDGRTVDIYKALDSYFVDTAVVQAFADGERIACFKMSGTDTPLRESDIKELTLFRVKGHETNLPQEKEEVHTMSLDFFTSDCATGFYVAGDSEGCDFRDKYINVWIDNVVMIEDDCDYCNDAGYAHMADSVTISTETIMGRYWEK